MNRPYLRLPRLRRISIDNEQKTPMAKQMIVMVGFPASGKSSYVQEHYKNSHVRVNLDTIKKRDKERTILTAILSTGVNVVIDNTNLTIEHRKRYTDMAKDYGYSVTALCIDVPAAECISIDNKRHKSEKVGTRWINALVRSYELVNEYEDFEDVIVIKPTPVTNFENQTLSLR